MSTVVTIEVVTAAERATRLSDVDAAIDRACAWFDDVEATCSRFLPDSELMRLSAHVGEAMPVGALLFETIRFALAVAETSGGAFDPTVGVLMAERGFDREHRSGRRAAYGGPAAGPVSYRDVSIHAAHRTVTLARPLMLDLGGIAKGLAVDMAARELAPFRHFAIDAGGDLYLSGLNAQGESWSVGIRHPREAGAIVESVRISDAAFCTSGDYERRGAADGSPHIVDPRTGEPVSSLASVSVKAPTAMVADALATAACVLGPEAGVAFLEAQGVTGVLYSTQGHRMPTRGFE